MEIITAITRTYMDKIVKRIPEMTIDELNYCKKWAEEEIKEYRDFISELNEELLERSHIDIKKRVNKKERI